MIKDWNYVVRHLEKAQEAAEKLETSPVNSWWDSYIDVSTGGEALEELIIDAKEEAKRVKALEKSED
jgi:hypothetical protein